MAHLVGAERIRLETPTRVILDDLSLGLETGDRIGVVGRNGEGKSTLLGILAGTREPDSGRVTTRNGVRIGVLDQEDRLGAGTVLASIVGGREEHEWAGDRRVREVLSGLLHGVDPETDLDALSGGQRRRVALAALLTGDHDVLLLDEPTNHLDIEGVRWLAAHLNARWAAGQGALVTVSHDRWFLDAVCTRMWEVHDRTVDAFEGGYAAYVLQRLERDRQARAMEERRQNLMRKELAWLRRGAPARTAKPKFRIEAANELIADVPPPRDSVALHGMASARLGKDVVDLIDASAAYDGTPILEHVEWRIAPGERTGILGRNGAGKSTLLALVDGTLAPSSGRVKHGKTVRVRRLTQQLDELEDVQGDRVLDVIGRLKTGYRVGDTELAPGQLLERLGFPSQQLSTRIAELSGGWKRRLQLLLVLLDAPNVLILDEPTNDLDTDMLTAMEDVLDTWPGTLIVVSHDRYLIERVTDQQYAVAGGRLRHLPGGVDEYLALEDGASVVVPSAEAVRSPGLSGAERRDLEKQLASLDRRMQRLTAETRADHDALATHDQSDYVGLEAIAGRIREREEERESLELEWIEAAERLESA
ncbi:ABC-F family ATP-binding cassette domain-containing protein [Amnibacterium kyonggiense]|uniref:ATPase subunit of ABC transporter with duplicated ATPase domains n=1 Tax=Amnibacterium kyonggiense TaxID=595671 RepID=A0A4R7FS66_9MICO|nr:ABC-F family ATP-binding cassette domain-containing protein [Amnibacterium kyonggiense]TDS80692.1 ATPase subunit of ABC transporter with duplicated ATPase domains [Amnibacterium kyonggiense]